ncbi:MAG: histidine kinase, partial [Bacteroidota bacterium]
MDKIFQFIKTHVKEITYQAAILLVLFLFFSYNQEDSLTFSLGEVFAPFKLAFFGNYLMATFII